MPGRISKGNAMTGAAKSVPRRVFAALTCLTAGALGFATGCSENPAGPEGHTPITILIDGGGGGDYTSIGAGIAAAREGDTVLVAPGIYTGQGNRGLDFEGVNIVLRAVNERDSVVIDCEGLGRAFHLSGGENATSVIEGFIIRNGRSEGDDGGAILCEGSSPTITDVVLRSNTASGSGGAIYCSGSSLTLTDVRLAHNSADTESGGAVFCLYSLPTLTGVVFDGNAAAGSGGGLASVFSTPRLTDVDFLTNHAGYAGGGLYCSGSFRGREQPSLDRVKFLENTARVGGAAALDASSPSIENASLARNAATAGGIIHCENGSSPTISHSIIAFSPSGGAVTCAEANEPRTNRCCIFGNADGDDPCGIQSDNLFTDPLFCDVNGGDLTLCENSQCLPDNNAWGELIGARESGCGACEESRR